jgi:hypothetical protein
LTEARPNEALLINFPHFVNSVQNQFFASINLGQIHSASLVLAEVLIDTTLGMLCLVEDPMKLTPFGFVSIAENFLRDVLALPPIGGGKWQFQRLLNFSDNTSTLHIDLHSEGGAKKTSAIMHAHMTGTARDISIQGWIQLGEAESQEPFVLRQMDATRAEEEIFGLVDRLVSNMPEADKSSPIASPAAPASTFEPLVPSKTAPESISDSSKEPEESEESAPKADKPAKGKKAAK